jgi:hypothetical protein
MKTTLALVTGLMAVVGSAHAMDNVALVNEIALAQVNAPGIMNVINWKVGEFQDLNLTMSGMALGTVHKEAMSEEGNGVWMNEVMAGAMIGNHTVEILLDRADGHVIKMKQDGKDTTPPDDKLEIINQETATVTVPAGTFETIHITAKSQKSGNIEVWANPQAITLDGTAKMNMQAQGMPLSMELTKFGGK